MTRHAMSLPGVTFADLYAEYPRFSIDVDREQRRLMAHDIIVFQFPLFWYSTPALLKQWQDLVLEYGFAYGPQGQRLGGKVALASVTTGGSERDYSEKGGNGRSFDQYLFPLQQTATLCGMEFLPPFVLHSANHIEAASAQSHIRAFANLLEALRDEKVDFEAVRKLRVFGAADLADLVRK